MSTKEMAQKQNDDLMDIQYQAKSPEDMDGAEKYSIRAWWSYLQANVYKSFQDRSVIYEKALKYIPQCYKIWYNYLKESIEDSENYCILTKRYKQTNQLFERSLEYMSRMPKIWFMYTEYLDKQKLITKTRQAFDKCLKSLPITQHEDMWTIYTNWALSQSSIATFNHVSSRYLVIDKDFKEEMIDYLIKQKAYNEASILYVEIIEDNMFRSTQGKNKFQLYQELCNLIDQHPLEIVSINVEDILRKGIKQYVDEVGSFWCKLADYTIKQGNFDKARQLYKEGINSVMTARDFNIVYNAFLQFEQEMMNALTIEIEENEDIQEQEIEDQMEKLEDVIDNRDVWFVDCKLRQNQNSIADWLTKIRLFEGNIEKVLELFTSAFNTIEPEHATNGMLSELYIEFSQIYYKEKDFYNFNIILEKASRQNFKSVEDNISILKYWIEILIKQQFYKDAILVIKQAIFGRDKLFNLSDNLQLWTLYIDLEINFGTIESIKLSYKRIIEQKIVTPYILLNYAQFLENNNYFEESFQVYEKGLSLFQFPAKYEIWVNYLQAFVNRYGNQKLERTRDLFEKVLIEVPNAKSYIFYLMYANYEENNGLLNHAFQIYDRMVANVEQEQQLQAYNIYIAKVSHFMGITKSRLIFENALSVINGSDMVQIGIRFAHLERKLGEIDRVRSIYAHISQFADPRDDDKQLWRIWNDFELRHGSVDTMKDYIRIKKSVISKFNLMPVNIQKIKQRVENELSATDQQEKLQ